MSALRSRILAPALGLALVTAGLLLVPLAPAQAAGSGGLVIKEVYGAGGNAGAVLNADFVELYNPQSTTQATNGLTIQYRSAGGGVGGTQALPNASVPPGGHYLIRMSATGANGAALPTPDLVASPAISMAAGGGQVILGTGTTFGTGDLAGAANVTDMVGQTTANTFETAAATVAASTTQSLNRNAAGADTNSNAADFSLAAPTPTAAGPAALSLTNPGPQTSTAGTAITPLNLVASGGTTPYTFSATNLPDGLSITSAGVISGTPTTAGTPTVTVTVTDSAGTPATDSKNFVWTVKAAPAGVTAIKDIQGTGTSSPITGQVVKTEAVVTASYPTGGLNGFYIQTPGADTANASDAIFVYGGTGGFGSYPTIGDSVDVTGTVAENFGQTELTNAGWTAHGSSLGTVTPKTVVPGTDCPLPGDACAGAAALDTAREAAEGEAFQPTGPWTLTDVYDGGPAYTVGTNSSSNFGELGVAAESSKALIAPTELYDTQTQATELANRKKWNDAHRIVVDDGSSTNYSTTTGSPFPWMTSTYVPRVGAAITFPAPAILISDFNQWRLLPSSQVMGRPTATQPQLQQTRAANAAPQDVGGDLKLATFNVLNFFPTDGNEYVGQGGGNVCTYFTDRQGNQITTNACGNPSTSSGNGPRGAANQTNVARQRDKIVSAINIANADIVSLEELENSAKFGKSRDFAITQLVNALNSASTPGKWDFAPSPTGGDLPALADEDVIRTGFIYQPAHVSLVGASKILVGSSAFANAREPLAQAFKKVGSPDSSAFAVIVNHFKSKGSGTDDGTGQGNANPDRIAQADALVTFANQFKTDRGISKVFLVGDFNAYSHEDPIDHLVSGGYTEVHSTTDPDEETYNFDGQIGSLDHVFANAAALPDVSGADVWPINGYESVYYEYSRYNYNVTNLYDSGPFRSSDHSPEIVGLNVEAAPITLNLLGVNDFHGRINSNTVKWAGTVEQLRAAGGENNTLFVGAGDLIGASEFASAIQDDQPTIDVMNALGLDATAVGNHEFDKGWVDLRDRVIGPDGDRNALWDYLGANVYAKGTEDPVLPEYAMFDKQGLDVAVIGAVTEETSTLVSPGGIEDIDFGDPVDAVNRVAGELSDGDPSNGEADVIVATFHAGATQGVGSDYAAEVARPGEFQEMANLDPDVDVIFNGHTHQVYAWDAPIPGQSGKTRPILQTGEYASNVGQVSLTVDPENGDVISYAARNVARTTDSDSSLVSQYPRVAEVKTIVDAALAHAAEVGNQPIGSITGDITTAFAGGAMVSGKYAGGTRDDRAAESTLGDLVGNALRDGVPSDIGEADLGIVNPGGLRADLRYAGDTSSNPANTDGVVTYAEANAVLPFVNNIWLVDLTGAELKEVLEQQWQTNPGGPAPSRPYLQLGLSDNVEVTADATKPAGSRITSVRIDGEKLDPAATYTVSTFSFLGTGGDNFRAFTQGAHQDTGLVDRDLWIQYLRDHDDLAPDFARQQVFESGLPDSVGAGDHASFTLGTDLTAPNAPTAGETLDLTSLGSPANTTVEVTAFSGGSPTGLGSFPVTNGTSQIEFTVPGNLNAAGRIEMVAQPSGTTVTIPLTATTPPGPVATTTTATAEPMTYGTDGTVHVTVTPATADGPVTVLEGDTTVGTGTITAGSGDVTIDGEALTVGSHTLTVKYAGNADHQPSQDTVTLEVRKASSTTTAEASPNQVLVGTGTATIQVSVDADGATPTGTVTAVLNGSTIGTGTLSGGGTSIEVGPFDIAGVKTIELRYAGNDQVAASSTTIDVRVVRAEPSLDVKIGPGKIKVDKTRATVTVKVTADGFTPSGFVTVKAQGQDEIRVQLHDGKAQVTLAKFGNVGEKSITVTYEGDDKTESASTTESIQVVDK